MAFVIADRVRETSTTTGTATYSLAGAEADFRTFAEAIGIGNTCPYIAVMGANWETGVGTVGTGTLARTSVITSSNGNNPVSWGAGTKQLAVAVPSWLIPLLRGGNIFLGNQEVRNEGSTGDITHEVRADGDFTPRRTLRKANTTAHVTRVWQERIDSAGFWRLRDITADTDRITLDLEGDLLPGADDAQDLGSASLRWQDLFMSGFLRVKAAANREVDIECTGDGAQPSLRLRKTGVTSDTLRDWQLRVNADGQLALRDQTANADRILFGLNGVIRPETDGIQNLGNATFRWAAVYAANGAIQTSDERLKEDIQDCDLGLEFVERLRPVSYRHKSRADDDDAPHYGLIAQEVVDALDGRPFGGIHHDAESDRYSLAYSELIAVALRGMQQLAAQVRQLEQRVRELEE